jgi:hypothetical protein
VRRAEEAETRALAEASQERIRAESAETVQAQLTAPIEG